MKILTKATEVATLIHGLYQKYQRGGSSYLLESPLLECGVIGTIQYQLPVMFMLNELLIKNLSKRVYTNTSDIQKQLIKHHIDTNMYRYYD